MKETAYTWWRQRAPRERQLISWGGAGLLAALCYAYLWQPITVERHKLRATLPQPRENAAQMQRQAQETAQLNMLDETRANISLATVSFDAWTALAASLQKIQGIRLESCTIEALPETGMVSVRAVASSGV